jgi:ribosomal protein S25
MAFSLWNTIQDSIGDNITSQISALLQSDKNKTQSGLQVAIPTILKNVISATKTEDGVAMLENELDHHDGSLLSRLKDVVSPEMGRTFAQDGTHLFDSFSGANATQATAALSRASGLGAGASRSMLGMMTPIVMGAIAKHRHAERLDSAQLLSCLDDQLINVEQSINSLGQAAMPATTSTATTVSLATAAGGAAIAGIVPEKLKALVKQCHDEFGPGEAITEQALAQRLGIPADAADQLFHELRNQSKVSSVTGALTDAPAIADRLVQKTADAFTTEERVTAPLLESRLGLRRQRAEDLLDDLKDRQLVGTTGAWIKPSATGTTGSLVAAATADQVSSARNENQVQSAPADGGGLGWLIALLLPLLLIGAVVWGLYTWSTGHDKSDQTSVASAAGKSDGTTIGESATTTNASDLESLSVEDEITVSDAGDSLRAADDNDTIETVEADVTDAMGGSNENHGMIESSETAIEQRPLAADDSPQVAATTVDSMNVATKKTTMDESDSTTNVQHDDAGDDRSHDDSAELTAAVGANATAEEGTSPEMSIGSHESPGPERAIAADGVVQASAAVSASTVADTSSEVTEVLRQLTKTINSIDDVSAARDSIPKLTQWTAELKQIAKDADQWDTSIRSSVDQQLRKLLPALGDSIDTKLGNKSISRVMQKPVEGLLQTIDQLIPKN